MNEKPVSTDLIKKLRELTGAGVSDCRNALLACNLDIDKAVDELRKKGIAQAEKKAFNTTNEGIVESYIHHDSKLGVLVEIDCETDFVAKTQEFKNLAREIAMQIAMDDPRYISREDIPTEIIERETNIYMTQLESENKPINVIDKILEGKLENFYKSVCLLDLPYMRDPKITIKELISQYVGQFKENIRVKRFARYKVGEEWKKRKSQDLREYY